MLMDYTDLDARDLQGSTIADHLIAIDALFRISDAGAVVYEEPFFPVVELARSLLEWTARGEGTDFVFDSMSFESPGSVIIVRRDVGWVAGSLFEPERCTAGVAWLDLCAAVRTFVGRVRADLVGLGLEADRVLGG